MNNKLDESEILDSFDPNRRGRRDMNPMFAKKDDRGGYHYRGMDGDRGGRKYENNRGREDNRNYGDNQRGRSGGYFRGNRDRDFGGENFRDNRGRDFRGGNYGDNRDRNFGGGNFRGNRDRDFRGGNFRGNRDRDYGGYRRGDFGRDRGRGMGRGRDFGGRNYGRGYNNTPFYHDDMGRDYDEMEDNFNRRRNIEENDEEYQMKKEVQYEKEKFWSDFKKEHKEIIESFKILFINEHLKDEQIHQIIINIKSNPSMTIFEAMNYIYREIQIIKTLEYVNSGNNREYGPNKDDIFEYKYEQYYPKKNLNEVIEKYKIYELNIENYQTIVSEKYWLYNELIKEENY